MEEVRPIHLDAPPATLEQLSFTEADVGALNQWVSNLPLVNTLETTTRLNLATQELSQLIATPQAKFDYLEAVRPLVHYLCVRLDRQQLDQYRSQQQSHRQGDDAGGDQAQPSAQVLMRNLRSGYKSVLLGILEAGAKPRGLPRDLTPKVIHRLISDAARMLLRSLQTYQPPRSGFWSELNQLYTLSESMDANQFRMHDAENQSNHDLTIDVVYLRALLIASCDPNKLQAREIASVYNALEDWAQKVILDGDITDASIIIDLSKDDGPVYARIAKNQIQPRALRTEVLAYEIEAYLKDVNSSIAIPKNLSTSLLTQLVESWGSMKDRDFRRLPTTGSIRVCVGLRAVHYFLSGGVDFAEQVASTDALLRREINPFLDVKYESAQTIDDDPWSQAHDLKVKIPENPNIETPERILIGGGVNKPAPEQEYSFDHFEAEGVNTSPGGYCIRWDTDSDQRAKVGEIVALREEADPRWCIAVVRWVRREGGSQLLGMELLAPRAIPVAARVIQTVGGLTDAARALLLPEIPMLKQPATIITPRVPFAAAQKIKLQRQGIQGTAQLIECLLNTESFNQFTFRMLDGYLESNRQGHTIDALSAMTREDTNQGS